MKKTIIYALLFIGINSQAFAQKDVQAKAILDKVSQKYHAYNIVKSDFTFTINDQQNNVQQSQDGTLIVQAKTNKYKLTLYGQGSKAVEQEIISDSKSQWTYLAKDKEVQLNKVDNSDEGFNPAQMFTLYEKGYKYLYNGDQIVNGKSYQVIDLTPDDSKKSFFKVRLMIDKVKKQLYSALIFDKNGSHYSYTINSVIPNITVPETTFTYDAKAHPGIEVVDLR
ncbi:Outer membrane lipoprotein-sorting protein [Mucilaginibacter mallensis]|uniref:Outer membrane lipoprotein-sorting protein n=1 Tax=Mucilaginibacter mallensis TaxID=652787 RepID=A0A1H1RCT9_MUCMA|nr:outer membrane lipoprotein carrier protein LolA [Mucilaginibacter mallensis]SDS32739.1 Outer membrane lipoprotein-sorting protein [Mucilaginibacter mallensis]